MRTVGIGFYWNDLNVGDRFKTLNRTITESDIVNFIGATGMVETLFTDLSFSSDRGAIQGRVVPAACVYAIVEGLLCQATMQTTGLALLEIEKKILNPVFAGDTVHAEVEVTAVRPTSKGNRGIVTTQNNIITQAGTLAITYRAVRMMAGRPTQGGVGTVSGYLHLDQVVLQSIEVMHERDAVVEAELQHGLAVEFVNLWL
jgi:acyl dehydratase